MTIDKQKLKALAEAASKVPDWYSPQSFGLSRVTGEAERDFIGAAGPATILALLEEIEQDEMHHRAFRDAAESVIAERDKLKAENSRLRTDNEAWRLTVEAERRIKRVTADELDRLKGPGFASELAALRKDAERYRAIRDEIPHGDLGRAILDVQSASQYDAAVDAAMAKEASHA